MHIKSVKHSREQKSKLHLDLVKSDDIETSKRTPTHSKPIEIEITEGIKKYTTTPSTSKKKNDIAKIMTVLMNYSKD